jgi:predicted AAA+ superfamily ATPase
MFENLVLAQKQEREKLLTQKYVWRQKLSQSSQFLSSDLVKVITGPRRSGKSIFALLLLAKKNFAYLNFDDENLLKVANYDELVRAIFSVYQNPQFFLFDEIQNLPRWEIFVNKLHRRGYNLILTGSNANLLSRELGTFLTGRYLATEVLPFSFPEFLAAKEFPTNAQKSSLPEQKGQILQLFSTYLFRGGFPEVVVKNLEPESYLGTLFEAVLFKDVVKRYRVRFSAQIDELASYLVTNFTGSFSFNKLKNVLGFASTKTVQNYLSYLEEAYLALVLPPFSFKKKEQIKRQRKVYLIDNGLAAAKAFQFSPNTGKLLENLVLVELLRKGHHLGRELFSYQTRNQKEVDFLLKTGNKVETLIQVCEDVGKPEVKKRELGALLEANEEVGAKNLLVVTHDLETEETFRKKKIKFLPLWRWLLG